MNALFVWTASFLSAISLVLRSIYCSVRHFNKTFAKNMDAERRVMIQALRQGKGDPYLNQLIFRVAKNKALAFKTRHEAEVHLEKKKHSSKLLAEMWRDFSAVVANAPHNSDEEGLGYRDRSLVLFHMKKYEEGLRDIERALKITKSNSVKVELYACKALCHAGLDQPEKSIALEKAEFYLKKVTGADAAECQKLKMYVKQAKRVISKIKVEDKPDKKAPIIAMLKQKETEDPFDNVDIRYDDKYGRHLVAKKDFEAGEIICVQKPYALSTNTDFLPFAYCCHCMCISWDSVPCISCGWALFCSEKCRDEAWNQYHDIECDVMPRVRDMEVPDIFKQLTIRTIILAVRECGDLSKLREEIERVDKCPDKRTKGFSDSNKFDGSQFRSLYSLAHNVSNEMLLKHIDDSLKVLFAFINCSLFFGKRKYNTIEDLLKDEDMIFVASLILRLIKVFNINYHGLFEDNILCENNNNREKCAAVHCCYRGMLITPLFALINHSCIPNALIHYTDANNTVLFATRPISKDMQIFVSYGYTFFFDGKSKRKVMLAKNYNFTCTCQACVKDWPIDKHMNANKEIKLPNVKEEDKIGSKQLDKIKYLVHTTIHKETHCLKQIEKLGQTFSIVIKNFAEPSYMICALMNAIERVSANVYLTKLMSEFP